MPVRTVSIRARRLLDPLNTHEWVEAAVDFEFDENDRVNGVTPTMASQYCLEQAEGVFETAQAEALARKAGDR